MLIAALSGVGLVTLTAGTVDVTRWLEDAPANRSSATDDAAAPATDDQVRMPPPSTDDPARTPPTVSDATTPPAVSDAPTPPTSPDIGEAAWRYRSDATITGVHAVGDLLLVADADGSITALDQHTGVQRWHARVSAAAVQLPAADPRSGLAIATTSMAEVIGIDVRAGIELWRTQVLGPAGSILLAPPGAEVTGTDDRTASRRPGEHFLRSSSDGGSSPTVLLSPTWTSPLVAVDGADGDQRWQATVDGRWVPVTDGVIVTVDDGLERWELTTGDRRWRVERPGEPIGRAGGFVVVRHDGDIAWLDPLTGAERGRLPATGTWWSDGPDDTMLLSHVHDDGSATLRAIAPDGEDRWRRRLPATPPGTPATGCCLEVSATADGHVLTVDRRGGGRDLLLDGDGRTIADLGPLLDDPDRWVVAVDGDVAIIQTESGLIGRSLSTGAPAWQVPGAGFLAATAPVVISTRSQVLAPVGQAVPARSAAPPRAAGRLP